MKDREKPRNFVKKFADEFTKPSRHRDRKHDYDRAHRREAERSWSEDTEVSATGREGKRPKRLREGKDRGRYYQGELGSSDWLEPEEDSSETGEV
jgi:hypothetical protein